MIIKITTNFLISLSVVADFNLRSTSLPADTRRNLYSLAKALGAVDPLSQFNVDCILHNTGSSMTMAQLLFIDAALAFVIPLIWIVTVTLASLLIVFYVR